MKIRIWSEYEKTKARLRDLVLDDKIEVLETVPENHACYFCQDRIKEKMIILKIEEKDGNSEYYIDEECYMMSKMFKYYDDLPISLN